MFPLVCPQIQPLRQEVKKHDPRLELTLRPPDFLALELGVQPPTPLVYQEKPYLGYNA